MSTTSQKFWWLLVTASPSRLDRAEAALVRACLYEADPDAVTTLRDRIPGSSGRATTTVLRSIGDRRTTAPDSYQDLLPWSLRVGAIAFEGGWLRRGTPTRHVGIVDGYAVAILTGFGGPVVRQSDADSADVRHVDALARALQERLAWEQAHL